MPATVATGWRSRLGDRWDRASQRTRTAAAWAVFLTASWVVLRPSLIITISLDDFVNPFFVYDRYGSSPIPLIGNTVRGLFRNGHFNVLGETFSALVFVTWNHVIARGIRYSLIYAITKFAVLILCAVVAARVLRRLATLAGASLGLWWSRTLVAAALFTTLQLHVPWSLDPVGSYPLYGYLPLAIGLFAFDRAVVALTRTDLRSLVIATTLLCLAILYYEINVAVVAALAPIVALLWRRRRQDAAPVRSLLARAAVVGAVPAAMTAILTAVAARTNRGYTGTDVRVGTGGIRLLGRTIGGSLPGAAWPESRRWLDHPLDITSWSAIIAGVIGAGLLIVSARGRRLPPQPRSQASVPAPDVIDVLLVAASMAVVWIGATLIQASTAKVRTDAIRLGFVYNYYAYGSVGIVLAAILLWPLLPRLVRRVAGRPDRRVRLLDGARPVLIAACAVFAAGQFLINDDLQRTFDDRLGANDRLLIAVSERPPEAERCRLLREWVALPFLELGYRQLMVDGLNGTYQGHFGYVFCSDDVFAS